MIIKNFRQFRCPTCKNVRTLKFDDPLAKLVMNGDTSAGRPWYSITLHAICEKCNTNLAITYSAVEIMEIS